MNERKTAIKARYFCIRAENALVFPVEIEAVFEFFPLFAIPQNFNFRDSNPAKRDEVLLFYFNNTAFNLL